ncbi:MAG: pyridoxal phosphate-dependent aminotransferase [Gammaproteobacteria bacterium]|nr:pyridoxal phosphate-dependent aminotransferase [Gammaproteobacteria bacterium]MDH5800183.1 pyridoxal phosphate-dependent aminotransferase [Gammaproteobacteria bacterium]
MSTTSDKWHFAQRLAHIEPFHVMAILARARELEAQGRSVVHMEIGEPDFTTPKTIINAGVAALAQGKTHYTPASGLPHLREAISRFYADEYGRHVPAQQIVVTPGASGALMLILAALVNPGDQVLMSDPGYPCNRHFVRLLEGEPVGVPVDDSSNYQITPELAQQHKGQRTVAVMVASPSNPTGTLLSESQCRDLLRWVEKNDAYLIVDEIYHGLVYDTVAFTCANLSERVFVINSFSKYFNMTGWRLGWLVCPDHMTGSIEKLAQNLFLAPPTISQYAALEAFSPATRVQLEQRVEQFKQRRDYLLPELRQLGFQIASTPQGAFYLYANCAALTQDSFDFSQRLLEQAAVAVTPGIDFGRHRSQEHLRFAYTTGMDALAQGINNINGYINK